MKLLGKTAHELHDLLVSKEVKSREITEELLHHIDEVEGEIGSFITLTPEDALATADVVDAKIAGGEAILPLEGIPMGIKDNICTDGVLTTSGSRMLYNFVPPYDATVVKKIKERNIPVLGKTNMDEFSMGSSTETSYFKKTRNPHDNERVPGGSGGSAAAVVANEAVFAIGSDTGGSVRQAASMCGLVGLKPTYGVVSRLGLIAHASSLDQIGPLTKDVRDCAEVLNLLAGHDKGDSTSRKMDYPDYTAALVDDVKGLRFGIAKEYIDGASEEVKAAVHGAGKLLEDRGAVVEEFSLPMTEYALPTYYVISSAEVSSNLARYDGIKYGYRAEKFDDLVELYKNSRSEGFGSEVQKRILFGTYVLSSGQYEVYYEKAQKVRTMIRKSFENALSSYDVILAPVSPTTAFKIGEKAAGPDSMYLSDICTVSANLAGMPAISVPCGIGEGGLPIGVQMIGKVFSEPTLFKAAYSLERSEA